MKQFYIFLLSLLPIAAFSQSTLYFSYDAAGNQILRDVVCINCGGVTALNTKNYSEFDKKLSVSTESFTAFPNPVTHKLKVQWLNDETNPLQSLQLRSANGSLVKKLVIKSSTGQIMMDFSRYAPGLYLLTGIGLKGETTTIKIIKQ